MGNLYFNSINLVGEKFAIKAIQKKRVKDYMTFKNEIIILKVLVTSPNLLMTKLA